MAAQAKDGELAMVTERLDLMDLLAELEQPQAAAAAAASAPVG